MINLVLVVGLVARAVEDKRDGQLLSARLDSCAPLARAAAHIDRRQRDLLNKYCIY